MEGGERREKEREKHQCVVASCAPTTGNLAHNPGMCWLGIEPATLWFALNPLSHTNQGRPVILLLPQSQKTIKQKQRRNSPPFQTCVCRIGSWGWPGEGLLCMVPLPGSSLDAWWTTGSLSPLLLAEGLASGCRACWELASFWATGHRDPPSRARGPLGRPSLRSGPLASGAPKVG